MLNGLKVAVILPGIDVEPTLERTIRAIPKGVVDDLIFVDDGSRDGSGRVARSLGARVFVHSRNLGYGAAQKTGYREALAGGGGVVVMVHPDFQYKPELVPAMASMVAFGGYDLVLGSRVLMKGALKGGMPWWKFVANRGLTHLENAMLGVGLSEYHTGYRAFSRALLEALPLADNRNDYAFDNEVIAQTVRLGFEIGEISCPTLYFDGMQTISFRGAIRYGFGCLGVASRYMVRRSVGGRGLDAWREGSALA
ncbi:MAG TPA: glycosyltransferase family 2 protein [Polyangiaceae bacterium]|jgi:glycosyltransferase involved in cell wall biosynthesis